MAMPSLTSIASLLVCLSLVEGLEQLAVSRLRPDGRHAQATGAPVRFTFAPTAGQRRGVEMGGFRLRVMKDQIAIAEKEVKSPQPVVEMTLMPGRYRWSVQWWSTTGELSSAGESEVLVAEAADAWNGVPWLGAVDKNEFMAEINPGGKSSDRVELLVATLGFGYVTINEKDVSLDVLSYSGWTVTDKRVLFRTYDVTALLNATKGGHIFVGLGCGYRCDPKGRFPGYRDDANRSSDAVPKIFRLQLRVNGKLAFHTGSTGWFSRQGPVMQDSVYDGETYIPAAAGPWAPAAALPAGSGPKGSMVPATFPGVQITRTDLPVSITRPADGVHVVDFGSNVAGVCSISVPEAATVTLKHGEIMQHGKLPTLKTPDPSRVDFGSLRSAAANDTLVLTAPIHEWWPRFTYHGFRYVEVYGFPGELSSAHIKRLVLHTAVEDKANVSLGDEVLQAIHHGSKGVQLSNLMQIPTDCPQRDERLGWMGDASLSAESFLLHFHYKSMAAAFLDSMADEMGADGSLPDVVPWQRFGGRPGDPSWTAAFLENLWGIWKSDGDLAPARVHWQKVRAYLGFLRAQYAGVGNITKLPQPYGDWCPPPATPGTGNKEAPPSGFPSAAAMVRIVGQIAELGSALGGAAVGDAHEASMWHAALLKEFHESYYDAGKQRYANGVMLTYVLPLALGAVPEAEKEAVVKNLLQYIGEHGNTWTGGIINNRFIFDVLHDNGAATLALAMLQRKDYPSYGYMYFNDLEPARECMWEIPDAPFQGDGMNSRAHHMFSSVGHYLVTRVAGISALPSSGEARLVVGLLGQSAATLVTDFGTVHFSWERRGNLTIDAVVPVGLQAKLFVPSEDGDVGLASYSSRPLAEEPGVLAVSAGVVLDGARFTRLDLASGAWRLQALGAELVV